MGEVHIDTFEDVDRDSVSVWRHGSGGIALTAEYLGTDTQVCLVLEPKVAAALGRRLVQLCEAADSNAS